MSEFEDLEGPRRDENEVHLVFNQNRGLSAILTSRVEARSMKQSNSKYRKTLSAKIVDGDAHIGDKLWFVFENSRWPTTGYQSEQKAQEHANTDEDLADSLYGGEVKHWNTTTEKLYSESDLEE